MACTRAVRAAPGAPIWVTSTPYSIIGRMSSGIVTGMTNDMLSSMTEADKVRENRLRRMAERQRLVLQKARRRDPNAWDYDTYQLVDPALGAIVFQDFVVGHGYGLSLDDVEAYLSERAERRPTLPEAAVRRTQANGFIPRGSRAQNLWKMHVLMSYSSFGTPIGQAVEDATAAAQAVDPAFTPQFEAALLELA